MEISNLYLLKSKYVSKEVGNELVLVPLSGNVSQMTELFTLNETGQFVWNNLTKKSTLEDLVKKMTEAYTVNEKEAETDILLFIDKLATL